jgi:hypothetical protein
VTAPPGESPLQALGGCPNYAPGDLDAPCEPDPTGYCLSCGFWAPLYPPDRSRPVLTPQGVMRRLMAVVEAADDYTTLIAAAAPPVELDDAHNRLIAALSAFAGGDQEP